MRRFVVKRLRLPANIVSFHREEGWYDPSLPGKNKVVSRRWDLETRDWPWASDRPIRCPFCGRESILFRNVPRSPARLGCWNCDAVFHLLSRKAVRVRARRLPKPSRKVELLCWECGWEGRLGRAETVRLTNSFFCSLACPECGYTPYVVTRKGVPRYVTESSIG
jgi:RNase P subunit RPR2